MRKFIFIMVLVAAASFYAMMQIQPRARAEAQVVAVDTQYVITPTFVPTRTEVPTATVGYEATLFIAQATADEARRVNAQVTSEAEQRILSYAQLTAGADARAHEVLMWTEIAGPTVIPLTATAAVIANTQISEAQRIVAAGYTAQAIAPTQQAAMVQIQTVVQYARINEIAKVFALFGLGVFLFGIGAFAFRWKVPNPKPESEAPTETVVQMRKDTGQGSFTQQRLVVPCTPEQLSELAELAVNGEKKFGINRLEQTSRTFRNQREILLGVRQWLVENKFVIPDGNGTITLNADGESFLAGWFDSHQLPTEYQFEEKPEDDNHLPTS